ncbi:hypothetical protein HJC23_003034, partial [Cyclotella cryptica]
GSPIRADSASRVNDVEQRLNNEIRQLVKDIWRVGDPDKPSVPFGELFDDEDVQQHYEGLAATLKAAKKRGIVTYKSPILLKGAHDKVLVNLVDTSPISNSSSPLVGGVDRAELDELKERGIDAKEKMTSL